MAQSRFLKYSRAMRRLLPITVALLVLAPVGTASAEPAPGQMELEIDSGLTVKHKRYVMRREKVVVVGTTSPFVSGQQAVVEIRRNGRVDRRIERPIRESGGEGRFVVEFKPRRNGLYAVAAQHEETDEQEAFRAEPEKLRVVSPHAGPGAHGDDVRLLHNGLRSLGFVAPSSSGFSDATRRAVIAFRKVNGMRRNGNATKPIYRKLLAGEGGFNLHYPGRGKHVEFDWSRQVLVLARGGRAQRIYHASSGKSSTPTVFGSFRFYRKDRGTNSHGMVHSSYFFRGYAIHGYKSVPTYPASHGCLRVPIPQALSIFNWIDIGDRIFLYE